MRRRRCFARARRSRKNKPLRSAASGAAASQTIVSAPSSGVRSSGPTMRVKPGSAVRSPGVSAQPGCMALTVMPVPSRCRVHSSASTTCARLQRAYVFVPSYVAGSGSRAATSSGSVYMPPDATTITRDGADASSRGRSARVNTNGDSTCVANVSSLPSPVTVCSWVSAPAFRTSTSRRSCLSAKREAKAAVSARDERSARSASTAEPAAAEISRRTRSERAGSRPTMQTCPPSAAIASAAARPRPEVAPVTIATLPSRRSDDSGAQSKRRRRA